MSDRQQELAARRDALIAQSSVQREQLQMMAGEIKMRLAGVDQGIEVVRAVAKKPAIVAGAFAMIAFIGPRRIVRALARSAMFIATGRRVMRLLRSAREEAAPAPSLPRREMRPLPNPSPRSGGGG